MSTWIVLLAGGVGSRFWPPSRAGYPKQLLDLTDQGPMLRVTYERVKKFAPADRTLVVTSKNLARQVADILPEVPARYILAEPIGKNTAPAIAWAAIEAVIRDENARLMVLPADHYIPDPKAFEEDVERALGIAATGKIVTMGIPPTAPETGYGYIRRGAARNDGSFEVQAFVEKPDAATAASYLLQGGYDWNSGMFFMGARTYLEELERFEPDMAKVMEDAVDVRTAYPHVRSVSVDYAVMEKTDKVVVLPATFPWSDVGTWSAMWEHRQPGASSYRRGDVFEIDSDENIIAGEGGLVCAIDTHGMIIVHTPDATLVCPRDSAPRVKEAVDALARWGRTDIL